jgi:hypothetical protein
VNLRFNVANRVFNHSFWLNITLRRKFGKFKWLALGDFTVRSFAWAISKRC